MYFLSFPVFTLKNCTAVRFSPSPSPLPPLQGALLCQAVFHLMAGNSKRNWASFKALSLGATGLPPPPQAPPPLPEKPLPSE